MFAIDSGEKEKIAMALRETKSNEEPPSGASQGYIWLLRSQDSLEDSQASGLDPNRMLRVLGISESFMNIDGAIGSPRPSDY